MKFVYICIAVFFATLFVGLVTGQDYKTITIVPGAEKPFFGFGTTVWPTDKVGIQVAADYGFKVFRSSVGPNWQKVASGCTVSSDDKKCPPVGKAEADYDTYVADNFDADCQDGEKCNTLALANLCELKSKGSKWVAINYYLPEPLIIVKGESKIFDPKYTKDLVLLYTAIYKYVKQTQASLTPDYIEINNEPDADWDAKIAPKHYSTIIKQIYTAFVTSGITSCILGPGTSQLDPAISTPYLDHLDSDTLKAIGAFNVHGWDPDQSYQPHLNSYFDAVHKKDANKHVIISEYGAIVNTQRSTPEFANSLLSRTFEALSKQPQAVVNWEAADQEWQGEKQWGIVDIKGAPYPAGNLFKNYLPYFKFDDGKPGTFLDINYNGVEGLQGAAVKGILNGTESIIVPYWNTVDLIAQFKHVVEIPDKKYKVVKAVHLDGLVSDQTGGYNGLDVGSIGGNVGALYVFQPVTSPVPAPPRKFMM